MKSTYFFVKSNYIKNTQKQWIYCECRLLYHQNITFLNLRSTAIGRNNDCNTIRSTAELSSMSLSRQINSQNAQKGSVNLNFLCNLSEFKTCEIKSVNFNGISKFGIKLVPSGLMTNKKLYLLPDSEDNLTEWCGLISGFMMNGSTSFAVINASESNSTAATVCNTLKAVEVGQNSAPKQDIYVSLNDNDAYEAGNENEYHMVTIQSTQHSDALDLHGNFLIQLGQDSLQLLKIPSREPMHHFPYASIRRFGAKDNLLRIEAGRRCSTGCGVLHFLTNDASHIAKRIQENARQFKERSQSMLVLNNNTNLNNSFHGNMSNKHLDMTEPSLGNQSLSYSQNFQYPQQHEQYRHGMQSHPDIQDQSMTLPSYKHQKSIPKQEPKLVTSTDSLSTGESYATIKKSPNNQHLVANQTSPENGTGHSSVIMRPEDKTSENSHQRSVTTIIDLPPPPPPPETIPRSSSPSTSSQTGSNNVTIPPPVLPPKPQAQQSNGNHEADNSGIPKTAETQTLNQSAGIPNKYEISESSYFRYCRKSPEPKNTPSTPRLTTPGKVTNLRAANKTMASSQAPYFPSAGTNTHGNYTGTSTFKKGPLLSAPPVLPKPNSASRPVDEDSFSFREFDDLIKDLNLTYL